MMERVTKIANLLISLPRHEVLATSSRKNRQVYCVLLPNPHRIDTKNVCLFATKYTESKLLF